jgi:hypothetical protein
MPAANTMVLLLAAALTLLGIVVTAVAWRRGRRGRAVQGVGLTLAPIGLYLSGLLGLLWNGVVAVGTWAGRVILSPTVWLGLAVLGLCLVLWVVGGVVARKFPPRPKVKQEPKVQQAQRGQTQAVGPAGAPPAARQKQAPPVDDDMAEIEALLKSRGIE